MKAKATTKSTVSTKADDKAKAVVTVKVSAGIQALIAPMATAQATAEATMKAAERQVINLGCKIEKDPELSKAGRKAAQEALKPFFLAAYKKAGKDEPYAGQQLSRVLTIAFGPASEKVSAKEREKIKANRDKAIANNAETQIVLGMSGGNLTYAKGDKIAKVEKTRGGSGGSNRKTPLEAFNAAIETAATAAHVGKVPPLAMILGLLDALVACEAIDQDEANIIHAASEEAL